jgi:hypothetical protein
MFFNGSLLVIVVTAILHQSSGEGGKWITASEALERSIKAESVPEEGCGKWVEHQMGRFNEDMEKLLKPKGYGKVPRNIDFFAYLGYEDDDLPSVCADAFVSELESNGFRVSKPHSGYYMDNVLIFDVEWGEEDEKQESNNADDYAKQKDGGMEPSEVDALLEDLIKRCQKRVDNVVDEIDASPLEIEAMLDDLMKSCKTDADIIVNRLKNVDPQKDEYGPGLTHDYVPIPINCGHGRHATTLEAKV